MISTDYRKKNSNHPGVSMKKTISFAINVLTIIFCLGAPILAQQKTPPSSPSKKMLQTPPRTPLHQIQPSAASSESPRTPAQQIGKSFISKVTPNARSVEHNFDIAWPTSLRNDGGKITISKPAAVAIDTYLALETEKGETSAFFCPLKMNIRVPKRFSKRLVEEVETTRDAGAPHRTPQKQDIDHALSPEIILRAIQFGQAYDGFMESDKWSLVIVVPVEVLYSAEIRRQKHLNQDGVLMLSFAAPDKPLQKQKNWNFILFHACIHNRHDPKLQNDLAQFSPVDVTLDYDKQGNILYFKQS